MENDRLSDKNKNFALFSTILNSITFLICGKATQDDSLLTNQNFQVIKAYVNETFDCLFSVLPSDITNRKKYLLGKALITRYLQIYLSIEK